MSAAIDQSSGYSAHWFASFLDTMPAERTAAECDVLARWLPRPDFRTVLDVCCGRGRHGRELARRGWLVTGLELDAGLVRDSENEHTPGFVMARGDMRDLTPFAGRFDAVMNLWQSFGQFSMEENAAVLCGMSACLRPGGRLILDIYYRGFFEAHREGSRFERGGRPITECRRLEGRVLHVSLDYGDGHTDRFTWELFTPEELDALAGTCGLRRAGGCAAFDIARAPAADAPRMQLLYEPSEPARTR